MTEGKHANDDELLAGAIDISSLQEDETPGEIELEAEESTQDKPQRSIRTFGDQSKQVKTWKRQPNADGTGATHVRTFVSKMRLDAIEHLDEQINEWLDEHPELEVKFVTTSHGTLTGKTKEEAMFVSVWV